MGALLYRLRYIAAVSFLRFCRCCCCCCCYCGGGSSRRDGLSSGCNLRSRNCGYPSFLLQLARDVWRQKHPFLGLASWPCFLAFDPSHHIIANRTSSAFSCFSSKRPGPKRKPASDLHRTTAVVTGKTTSTMHPVCPKAELSHNVYI